MNLRAPCLVLQHGDHQIESLALSPCSLQRLTNFIQRLPHLDAFGIVGRLGGTRERRIEDQRPDTLRIGRREEDGQGPAFGEPYDRGSF